MGLAARRFSEAYPTLEPIHIDPALAYAADLAPEETLFPSGPSEVFKLDENLSVELLDDPRAAGHEADGLRDGGLIAASDDVVLDLVRRENRD